MNRKKKLNQIFNKRLKKAKAKLNPNQKDRYVSKAEREALESADNSAASVAAAQTTEAQSSDPDQ